MVMEKSWNMQNWPKVMERCYQSWNFANFAPKLYEICLFFATTVKLNIHIESLHFLMFSAKCGKNNFEKRDTHGKLRNGLGKVMEKYFVKSVGTLPLLLSLKIHVRILTEKKLMLPHLK